MFCPKCGGKAIEGQRFCKACGTNLDLVSDALEGGEDTLGQLRLDIESLKKNAKNIAKGVNWNGYEWNEHRMEKRKRDLEARVPKPKEWLAYSWQHNLKNGLMSLFGGAGLAMVLYYLGQIAIEQGLIQSIEDAAHKPINGLESIMRVLWLFALIPVLKGIGQIIYAALFAESIATLSARFMPQQLPPQPQSALPADTAPITSDISTFEEPPPSVTEHTTRMFDPQQPGRESQ